MKKPFLCKIGVHFYGLPVVTQVNLCDEINKQAVEKRKTYAAASGKPMHTIPCPQEELIETHWVYTCPKCGDTTTINQGILL